MEGKRKGVVFHIGTEFYRIPPEALKDFRVPVSDGISMKLDQMELGPGAKFMVHLGEIPLIQENGRIIFSEETVVD